MVPRYLNCCTFVDYLSIGTAWWKIFQYISIKKFEIDVIATHLIYTNVIPFNLSIFAEHLTKLVKDKLHQFKKSLKLEDFEIKEIINEELAIIKENLDHNEEIKISIQKVLEEQPKLTTEMMVLKNRLKCIELMETCKAIYCDENAKPVPLADFQKLETEIYLTGYRGHFFRLVVQELENFRVLKENLKSILKDYKISGYSTN